MNPCETLQQRWQACRMGITEQGAHPRASFARMQQTTYDSACFRPIELHGVLDWKPKSALSTQPCRAPRRKLCRRRKRGLWMLAMVQCTDPFAGVRASDWLKELD